MGSVQGIMQRGAWLKRGAVSVLVWGKEGRVRWRNRLWYHRSLGIQKLWPKRSGVWLIGMVSSEVVWRIQWPVWQEIRRIFRNDGRGEWF